MLEELEINEKNIPKINALSREIFKGRGLSIRSWMRLPTFRVSNRGSCYFNTFVSLFLSFKPIDFNPDAKLSAIEKRMSTFTVSERNYEKVKKFFNDVSLWVVSPAVERIYDYDPVDGRLRVSNEFNGLSMLLVDNRASNSDQAIKATPMTCDGKDGRTYPGAEFSVNQEEFKTVMPSYDLISLASVISDFSFQQEQYLLMTMLTHKDIMVQDTNDYGDFVEKENPFGPASHPVN